MQLPGLAGLVLDKPVTDFLDAELAHGHVAQGGGAVTIGGSADDYGSFGGH